MPTMSFKDKLRTYANIIVSYGVNLQHGQPLFISSEPIHRELVSVITELAYKKGAKHVYVDLIDPRYERIQALYAKKNFLDFAPSFIEARAREIVDDNYAYIYIDGMEDPDILEGIDTSAIRGAYSRKVEYFNGLAISKSRVQWCVVAGPTPGWAKKIFPKMTEEEAYRTLWNYIFKINRSNKKGAMSAWRAHFQKLRGRCDKLNRLGISKLNFKGKGTDLTVGLSTKAIFMGGLEKTHRGIEFCANIPAEEVYTTPNFRETRGYFTTTRPSLVGGNLISDLRVEFDNTGRICNFFCKKGGEVFKRYINTDYGAKMAGEIALVGTDSPIYKSGVMFESILLDENAACHMAVGEAYKACIRGFESMNQVDFKELGVNESCVHLDMMISDNTTDVTAVMQDGTTITLIKKGKWQI